MIPQQRFKVEFVLHAYNISGDAIKSALVEFTDTVEVCAFHDDKNKENSFRILVTTLEPALVFDVCAQFGRIRSAKVDEEGL